MDKLTLTYAQAAFLRSLVNRRAVPVNHVIRYPDDYITPLEVAGLVEIEYRKHDAMDVKLNHYVPGLGARQALFAYDREVRQRLKHHKVDG